MNHFRLRPRCSIFQHVFTRVRSFEEFSKLETPSESDVIPNSNSLLSQQTLQSTLCSSKPPIAASIAENADAKPGGANSSRKQSENMQGKQDIAAQKNKENGGKMNSQYGYTYSRLKREFNLPQLDSYELKQSDIELLRRMNEERKGKGINEEILPAKFSGLIVHFERKSTRMTTATQEEIAVEFPYEDLRVFRQEDIQLVYQYWKQERENPEYFYIGDEFNQQGSGAAGALTATSHGNTGQEKYPFLRKYWRTSFDDPNPHGVYKPREAVRMRTRKPQMIKDSKDAQERVAQFQSEVTRCFRLISKVREREQLKRQIAAVEISSFLGRFPELKGELVIQNQIGDSLRNLVQREEAISESKKSKKKQKKEKGILFRELSGVLKLGGQGEAENGEGKLSLDTQDTMQANVEFKQRSNKKFKVNSEIELSNASEQQQQQEQGVVERIQSEEVTGVSRVVVAGSLLGEQDVNDFDLEKLQRQKNNLQLNKRNSVSDAAVSEKDEPIILKKLKKSELASDLSKRDVLDAKYSQTMFVNSASGLFRGVSLDLNYKQDVLLAQQKDFTGDIAGYLANVVMFFTSMQGSVRSSSPKKSSGLPITIESANDLEAIQSRNRILKEEAQKVVVANQNLMAFMIRQRTGRSNRVFIDRLCAANDASDVIYDSTVDGRRNIVSSKREFKLREEQLRKKQRDSSNEESKIKSQKINNSYCHSIGASSTSSNSRTRISSKRVSRNPGFNIEHFTQRNKKIEQICSRIESGGDSELLSSGLRISQDQSVKSMRERLMEIQEERMRRRRKEEEEEEEVEQQRFERNAEVNSRKECSLKHSQETESIFVHHATPIAGAQNDLLKNENCCVDANENQSEEQELTLFDESNKLTMLADCSEVREEQKKVNSCDLSVLSSQENTPFNNRLHGLSGMKGQNEITAEEYEGEEEEDESPIVEEVKCSVNSSNELLQLGIIEEDSMDS